MSKVKTFQADTMAKALACVKRELGPDAMILHTRKCEVGGVLGVGKREVVEITATVQPAPVGLPKPDRDVAAAVAAALKSQPRQTSQPLRPQPSPIPAPAAQTASCDAASGAACKQSNANRKLMREVNELKTLVTELVDRARCKPLEDVSENIQQAYQSLIEADLAEELARRWVDEIRELLPAEALEDAAAIRRQLRDCIERSVPTVDGVDITDADSRRVIALVGPTGVGKTTTIAKIAADVALRQGRHVGLITTDSRRIAAAAQLRTYADVVGVPMLVANDADELTAALSQLRDCDLVLIDTAGNNPTDEVALQELRYLLNEAAPDEIHLCLAATSSRRVLDTAVSAFGAIGADRLVFTKMDEAVGFGVLLSCLSKADLKLSYLTTGQNIPNDMEIGGVQRLALLVAGD